MHPALIHSYIYTYFYSNSKQLYPPLCACKGQKHLFDFMCRNLLLQRVSNHSKTGQIYIYTQNIFCCILSFYHALIKGNYLYKIIVTTQNMSSSGSSMLSYRLHQGVLCCVRMIRPLGERRTEGLSSTHDGETNKWLAQIGRRNPTNRRSPPPKKYLR